MKTFLLFALFFTAVTAESVQNSTGNLTIDSKESNENVNRDKRTLGVNKNYNKEYEWSISPDGHRTFKIKKTYTYDDGGAIAHLPTLLDSYATNKIRVINAKKQPAAVQTQNPVAVYSPPVVLSSPKDDLKQKLQNYRQKVSSNLHLITRGLKSKMYAHHQKFHSSAAGLKQKLANLHRYKRHWTHKRVARAMSQEKEARLAEKISRLLIRIAEKKKRIGPPCCPYGPCCPTPYESNQLDAYDEE